MSPATTAPAIAPSGVTTSRRFPWASYVVAQLENRAVVRVTTTKRMSGFFMPI